MLQMYLIDVAIPHQSQIGFEEPICDSFPPGEAVSTFLNCKINYNLPNQVLNNLSRNDQSCYRWNKGGGTR